MSIFNIFSKRQKALRGDAIDVYSYNHIPEPLKVQIVHIWRDSLGDEDNYYQSIYGTNGAYKFIVEALCREYGVFFLPGTRAHNQERNYFSELITFLMQEQDHEKILDTVELSFRFVDRITRDFSYLRRRDASEKAESAIVELNTRFREHCVGYQFLNGEIIRVDSELIHTEVVKPALTLLQEDKYAGAQAEFLKAHEHYRHGRAKESLAECLKSLESVMKTICGARSWNFDPNDTCKNLIKVLIDNGLIPTFWTQHFSALRSTIESGVPTARNKLGGHGQGPMIVKVPDYIVAYVLHLTASAILFLVEVDKNNP